MLSRRKPLERKPFKVKVKPQAQRAERVAAPLRPLAAPPRYIATSATPRPDAKAVERRNPALLRDARDRPCLLMVPGVCNMDRATTVACHSNWAEHGKGAHRKADDCYTVWGCSACHRWLDQGGAPGEQKKTVFMLAMARQAAAWVRAADANVNAAWAVHHLQVDGYLDATLSVTRKP